MPFWSFLPHCSIIGNQPFGPAGRPLDALATSRLQACARDVPLSAAESCSPSRAQIPPLLQAGPFASNSCHLSLTYPSHAPLDRRCSSVNLFIPLSRLFFEGKSGAPQCADNSRNATRTHAAQVRSADTVGFSSWMRHLRSLTMRRVDGGTREG